MKTHKIMLTGAVFVLGFIGMIFAPLGASLFQLPTVQATTSTCDPLLTTCNPISPTGTKPSVTSACSASKQGFPTVNDNPVPQPTTSGSAFFACEVTWANTPPSSYVPGNAVGNNPADYCHRNFTGAWLSQCNKGFGKNGHGSTSSACGSNEPACVVGFAVGGNPNQNPHASPPPGVGPGTPVSSPHHAPSSPTGCDPSGCDLIKTYVNPAINLLSAIFGLIAVASIIMGGIQYAASEGDPQKAAKAKDRIYNTLIAIFAYLFLYAFLQFLVPGGFLHG